MEQFIQNFSNSPDKQKIMKAVFATFVLLAVFLGVKSLSALKEFSYIGEGTYPSKTISVYGKGEVLAIPDTGLLSFSVIETGKTVAEAQDKSAKKINSAIDALLAMSIDEKDIKTTNYNSYPKYDYTRTVCSDGYCPPSKPILIGYEVSQSISVKIRATADAGAVLTKIGTIGVQNISGLSFVVDDIDLAKAEARNKAIANAREEAKILAKSLGVRLKRIVSFYENVDQPMYYGASAYKDMSISSAPAPVVPQTPVGENEIQSNITITYEID